MGILDKLFKPKQLIKAEVVNENQELSDDDKLLNYAAGHLMGGFDGMVQADILNETKLTTFKLYYDNGSTKFVTVENNSAKYNYYINFTNKKPS